MPDFDSIMQREAGSAERPRPAAVGTYRVEFDTWQKRSATVEGEEIPITRVNFIPVNAEADVDPAENEGLDLSRKRFNFDFWLRESQLYQLDDFIAKTMGVNSGGSYAEQLDECKGRECMAYVEQRSDDSGEPRWNDIKSLAPLP